jgi:hypothetical protein
LHGPEENKKQETRNKKNKGGGNAPVAFSLRQRSAFILRVVRKESQVESFLSCTAQQQRNAEMQGKGSIRYAKDKFFFLVRYQRGYG